MWPSTYLKPFRTIDGNDTYWTFTYMTNIPFQWTLYLSIATDTTFVTYIVVEIARVFVIKKKNTKNTKNSVFIPFSSQHLNWNWCRFILHFMIHIYLQSSFRYSNYMQILISMKSIPWRLLRSVITRSRSGPTQYSRRTGYNNYNMIVQSLFRYIHV